VGAREGLNPPGVSMRRTVKASSSRVKVTLRKATASHWSHLKASEKKKSQALDADLKSKEKDANPDSASWAGG
jgi:hypothetical protein